MSQSPYPRENDDEVLSERPRTRGGITTRTWHRIVAVLAFATAASISQSYQCLRSYRISLVNIEFEEPKQGGNMETTGLPTSKVTDDSETAVFGSIVNSSKATRVSSSVKLQANATDNDNQEEPLLTTTGQSVLSEPHTPLPPIEAFVQNDTIVGNVSTLLQFAIIGYAKCGTSAVSAWLGQHDEVDMIPGESFALYRRMPHKLAWWLHSRKQGNIMSGNYTGRSLPKQGYKQPKDIYALYVLQYFSQYWPDAKLIVTLRHPIRWFESYYNFREWDLSSEAKSSILPLVSIGRRLRIGKYMLISDLSLETGLGQFHVFLSVLGKTLQNEDEKEWPLLQAFLKKREVALFPFERLPNKVFLLDTAQMSDSNMTQIHQLRQDLGNFLDLTTPLSDIPHLRPETRWQTKEELALRNQNRVNICDAEYEEYRAELLRIGQAASVWIQNPLLVQDDVMVSSHEYFCEILDSWKEDPCAI